MPDDARISDLCLLCRRTKGQAFPNHREDREGVKALRIPQTPTESIKSEVKTREYVSCLDFCYSDCPAFQPLPQLRAECWGLEETREHLSATTSPDPQITRTKLGQKAVADAHTGPRESERERI